MTDETEDYPGKRVIEALGMPKGHEYQARDLNAFQAEFEERNRKCAETAFRAINLIAANKLAKNGYEDPCAKEGVPVPWWVVLALAISWDSYLASEGRETLGQSFGMEGRGQGRHQ